MDKSFKNINKTIIYTIILIIFLGSLSNVSYGQSDDIYVYIDQERVEFDVNPIIKENRVLVPMRKIFETLDAQVTWHDETKSVYANKENIGIKLTIDSNLININGEEIIMDSSPILHKGTTLVPLRIISETYGFEVKWIPENKEVRIITNPAYVKNQGLKLDLGMSLGELVSTMGSPDRIDPGEFKAEWYTYNNSPANYEDYILIRVEEDRVTGFQTNSKNWTLSDLIQVDDKFYQSQFNNNFKENHYEKDYEINIYVYKFNNIVNSFSIMEGVPANLFQEEYSDERLKGMEQQIFDMTNVYRMNNNLNPLIWNNRISNFARNHSKDMVENDYFSHDSLTQSFQERIQPLLRNGDWYRGGENLGYGYFDSIVVMNGWYNSEGHNENLLYEGWKYHGVGVLNTEENKLYATQNFTR